MARYMRSDLGAGHTKLRPPTVVGEGVVFPPIAGTLHPLLGARQEQRKEYRSVLRPPTAVTAPVPFVAAPVTVTVAPSPRQDRVAHPRLQPPVVVFAAEAFGGVGTQLVRTPRIQIKSVVRPPAVVAEPFVEPLARPVRVVVAASTRGKPRSRLLPPTAVGEGIVFPPIHGTLTPLNYASRPVAKSRLLPPAAVTAEVGVVYYGPQTTLALSAIRQAGWLLRPPVVVAQAEALVRPVVVRLAPQPQQGRFSRCFGGATISRSVVRTNLVANGDFETGTAGWTAVSSVLNTDQPGLFGADYLEIQTDDLAAVEGAYTTFYAGETGQYTVSAYISDVHGSVGTARLVVRDSAGGSPQFGAIFSPGLEWKRYSLTVTLTPGTWRLSIETDVQQNLTVEVDGVQAERGPVAWPFIPTNGTTASSSSSDIFGYERCVGPQLPRVLETQFFGPNTQFARISPAATAWLLRPPTVLATDVFFGPSVTVAPQVRTQTIHRLFPPTDVTAEEQADTTILIRLAPSSRGTAKSRLFAPSVVGEGMVFAPIFGSLTPLTYATQPKPKSVLRPPIVVTTEIVVVYYGPSVTLAPSSARQVGWLLRPPMAVGEAAVFYARPVMVRLAPSRRLRAKWGLAAPAVVFIAGPVLHPVTVTLAYSVRGVPRSFLRRPLVVGAVVYYGPTVNLAYSRRGVPSSELRPPTVIDLRPQVFYLSVTLARIRPQPTLTRLAPSAVTEALPKAERDIRVTLAYSLRGQPKSVLGVPVVIDLTPQTRFLSVNLTYSRHGQAKSRLGVPTVVGRVAFYGPSVNLAYSRRPRARYGLAAPAVVSVVVEVLPRVVSVNLTYSRRGRPSSQLLPPAVVGAGIVHRPVQTTLAYSRRGTAKPFLTPPAAVGQIVFYGPLVVLTPSKRGAPTSLLKPPTVVAGPFVALPVKVTLATTKVPFASAFIKPPTVVDEPEISYAQVVTWLVRIVPPPVMFLLKPPTVVSTFHPPQGDVCGTDEPAADVCGSDSAESRIVGSDTAVGDVCGTDQQST